LIAAVDVVLALGLLVIGGVALWGALSAEGASPPGGTTGEAKPVTSMRSGHTSRSDRTAVEALALRVIGERAKVFVSVPDTNPEVLFNGVLTRGEERHFDEPRMYLVVSDAGAVEVIINGEVQPTGQPGKRQTYTITKA
jgi:hypothetical protein